VVDYLTSLRISDRSAATREVTLRFTHGVFTLPGEPAEATVDEPGNRAETLRERIWALPCYMPSISYLQTGAVDAAVAKR